MMSRANRSIVFLALTFAISWGVSIGGWAFGAHTDPGAALFTFTAMMFGPALAALICAFAFEKGGRVEALGLRFAWLIPLALAGASVVLTVLLSDRDFADPAAQTIATVAAQVGEAKADELRALPWLGAALIGASVVIGPLLNAPILTFSEELG